jgi:hypothetical protein
MRAVICIIVAACFSVALGCSSPSSRLIGKWADEKNEEVIEFFKDNTYIIPADKMPISGKWTLLDDGRVKINIESFGVTQSFISKMDGDKFIFSMGGQNFPLHKIK